MKCLKEIQGGRWAKMDSMPCEMKENLQKWPTRSLSSSFLGMAFGLCSVVCTHEAQGRKRARRGAASRSCPCASRLLPHTPQGGSCTHRKWAHSGAPSPSPPPHGSLTVDILRGKPASTMETWLSLLVLLWQISQTKWLEQKGLIVLGIPW